jgi:predicted nucleotidyltransferase
MDGFWFCQWHNGGMNLAYVCEQDFGRKDLDDVIQTLVTAGATFAIVHGSSVSGNRHSGSDFDVAAYFSTQVPISSDILLPQGVDLSVLNDAPLEFKGRIAAEGTLLFEIVDEGSVEWVSTTRKIYFDERYRFERFHREFLETVAHG